MRIEITEGRFVRRVSRVSAIVLYEGREELVHLNNTGKLLDILQPGVSVALMPIKGKKTRFRIVGTRVDDTWYTLIDTNLQEKAVVQWIQEGRIGWLRGYRVSGKHVRVGNSRIDLLLKNEEGEELFLEIKSAVFYFPEDSSARYPDTVTERGQKHIRELSNLPGKGGILFVAAHPYARLFRPCFLDPMIPPLLENARRKGVILRGISLALKRDGKIELLNDDLPVILP